MVKPINVNISYKNDNQLFICNPNELLEKVAEHFSIDMRNIELYAVKRNKRLKIDPDDICDLMKIVLVDKNIAALKGVSRTLRSYFETQSMENDTFVENVVTKLRNNSPLSGQERKIMIDWLLEYSKNGKQNSSAKSVAHKKTQVAISSTHSKESFSQTDFVITETNDEVQEEQIVKQIKMVAHSENKNEEEIAKLMKMSFDDRRLFICTKVPPVAIVKDKYPLLFCLSEVKNELERIFWPGKCEEFIKNMKKYSKYILNSCDKNDEIYVRTQKSIERAYTEKQKLYASIAGSVYVLSKILSEEFRFIHLSDYPHSSSDVYPHIDASCHELKDTFFDNVLYHIIVEGQKLCEAPNLIEAILCLIACFFIFNIDYPDSCRRTLIVFEKIFLCANDTSDIDELTSQLIKMLQLKVSNVK